MKNLLKMITLTSGILLNGFVSAENTTQAVNNVVEVVSLSTAEKEVEAWYRSYASYWYNADVNIEKVSKFYASPFYYLAGDGPLIDTTETQKAALKTYVSDWGMLGWTGSRLLNINVKILNENSAMILTEWDIYNEKGETIIGCDKAPWTYLASRTNGRWALTMEIEIECGQGIKFK
jgi:hypothetical protein